MVIKPVVSDMVGEPSLGLRRRQIPDNPELRAKLTPDYPAGCKRVLLSDDYFPAINKSHVRLETRKIERITTRGVLVDGDEEQFDVLILATGFRTLESMHRINVVGLDGRKLADVWRQGARAYFGVTVPNLRCYTVPIQISATAPSF